MSEDRVVALNGSVEGVSVRRQLCDSLADTAETFEANGTCPPTAAVFVVMDDEGGYRVGWDSRRSSLPGSAVLGIAVRALTNVR